jgi:hypothetical protein
MLDLTSKPILSKDYTLIQLDEQHFFLPVTSEGILSERLFSLNEMCYDVVKFIDGNHTIEQIIELVTQYYDVEKRVAEQDIRELIGLMENYSILFLQEGN